MASRTSRETSRRTPSGLINKHHAKKLDLTAQLSAVYSSHANRQIHASAGIYLNYGPTLDPFVPAAAYSNEVNQ